MTKNNLSEQIQQCRKCRLWKNALSAVPGEGPLNAKVMLVGQNPGSEEDKSGKPFVGRAGKFLNKVLIQNGLNREELFVTNIVKHATPKNRKPLPEEIEQCLPYLMEQIKLIEPRVIVLMGALAWQTPRIDGIKYFETVHPSAAMRFSKMRKRFLTDFEALTRNIQESKS